MALSISDITLSTASWSKRRLNLVPASPEYHRLFRIFWPLIVPLAVHNPGTGQSPPAQSLQPCSLVRSATVVSAQLRALKLPRLALDNRLQVLCDGSRQKRHIVVVESRAEILQGYMSVQLATKPRVMFILIPDRSLSCIAHTNSYPHTDLPCRIGQSVVFGDLQWNHHLYATRLPRFQWLSC